MSKEYQVYVLENAKERRYIGLSEDVDHRLGQHNNGESKWTAKHGPWKLIWTSSRLSLSEARKLENKMKRQKSGIGLQVIMDEYSGSSGS
ncbi:GIY-YIG nuclease family protein [Puniceicoccus vermicola]|uniref:GIY-YIG nuclease family protein n=1 Tax=Puniceicoccus vermicola TaxID=388746 RepID=A0A7X1AZH9_9BACT|nr:GIY-YIG nuclease family protein [Puniceicoccus vermicola]MBC2601740.1 GIY-YIG nuclease family protein [Puniceicoccus vermicola]